MKKENEKLPKLKKAALQIALQKKTAALAKIKHKFKTAVSLDLALERVRARTMAMKHSDELEEIIQVIYEQFVQLNIYIEHTGFIMDYKVRDDMYIWLADKHGSPSQVTIPYFDSPHWNSFNKAKEKGISFFTNKLNAGEANKFYKGLFKFIPGVPEEAKEFYFNVPGLAISTVLLEDVGLYIENFSGTPYTDEENNTLIRFGQAFQQTYTRFGDLQKAEAQARESQIQLALERVRVRTMAMQKSSELTDVAAILFQQVNELGINVWTTGFNVWSDDNNYYEDYITNPKGGFVDPYTIDSNSFEIFKEVSEARKKGERFYVQYVEGERLKRTYEYLSRFAGKGQFQSILESGFEFPSQQYDHFVFGAKASLMFITYAPVPESHEIFKRFGKAFDQTYTRFLDLQNLEAQGRETQIQLALERTRTQSMLMQQSKELDDTLRVFHEQVLLLGIQSAFSFLWLPDEEKDRHIFWAAWAENAAVSDSIKNGSSIFRSKAIDYPLDRNDPATAQCMADWKGEEPVVAYYVPPDGVKSYFAAWQGLIAAVEQLKPEYFSDGLYYVEAFMKYGCFGIMVKHELPDEEKALLNRFAIEFERAYTRFLDLRKAEAQARESTIEAALEKIRSRSLAMHQSDELKEVMSVMFHKLTELDVLLGTVAVQVFDPVTKDCTFWIGNDKQDAAMVKLPYNEKIISEDNYMKDYWEARNTGKSFFNKLYSFEQKNKYFQYVFANNDTDTIPPQVREFILNAPSHINCLINETNSALFADNYSNQFYTQDKIDVLKRTAKVFDQAYVRFLDLQKAEAQAREGQIQLALERVRARTMAMQYSDELAEAAQLLYQQFKSLGIQTVNSAYMFVHEDSQTQDGWAVLPDGSLLPQLLHFPLTGDSILDARYQSWKEKKTLHHAILDVEENKRHHRFLAEHVAEFIATDIFDQYPDKIHFYSANFSEGYLFIICTQILTENEEDILSRFARVFEQTYTRFLDLKKAEAQTREVQIGLSLERIRAKTMAMHNSADVADAVVSMFDELLTLGIEKKIRCGIGIIEESMLMEVWTAYSGTDEKTGLIIGTVDMSTHQMLRGVFQSWKNKETHTSYLLSGEDEKDYYHAINSSTDYPAEFDIKSLPTKQYQNAFYFREGFIYVFSPEKQLSAESIQIFTRFANAFALTYRRFLDLQKAEAQAREAQIELSLERVRAKTMAMHNSRDVGDTVAAMFDEAVKLGIETIRCGIGIMHEPGEMEVWTARSDGEGKADLIIGRLDMMMHPLLHGAFDTWRDKQEFYTYELVGDDLISYFKAINNHPDYPIKYDLTTLQERIIHSEFHFAEGTLFVFSSKKLSPETTKIFKRFAGVFGQTYRRYLDLKKAEAQAKESTIEAALEKVRARAMSMHDSNDVSSAASMVFTELRKLGINPIRCGVGILSRESRKAQLYSDTAAADGGNLSLAGWVILSGNPVMDNIYDWWQAHEDYFPVLAGDELESYYTALLPGCSIPSVTHADQKQFGHFLQTSIGSLYAWADAPYNETEIKTLKRFASIIDLTFRRYMDLQKSEANASDVIKQASLDRIRAEIASMRTPEDLERITPLVWNELTILGIPFIRCGVFIMDEVQQQIHTFLSTPDGKAIAAFHLSYDTPGNFAEIVSHWHRKEKYISHWGESEFLNLADTLFRQKAISSPEQYISNMPKGGIHLHFLPFLQGMLYVGNKEILNDDALELVQNLADAFSTAYARYEDFNKLEAAKGQVEKTLVHLKQAQAQLVQSEKMASLGELTAGIAHEIQNPLNFVNNFSEVSNELMDEMNLEIEKGGIEEAKALARDIKQNLEKINHHGKRADAIVKGMLQHSGSSSATKEPTDINRLADEYLRLSYHGLRAKDKSFNTVLKTDFDESIGRIYIIPQDIGRVLLNLYNNAFYEVAERKKQQPDSYEPTVIAHTKKVNDNIEISVQDNGNGIPQRIVDKIFQPFFTTKPTGQGTGLGLSLAYDIVKAHSGEFKVETKEGEGTIFIIQLPVV